MVYRISLGSSATCENVKGRRRRATSIFFPATQTPRGSFGLPTGIICRRRLKPQKPSSAGLLCYPLPATRCGGGVRFGHSGLMYVAAVCGREPSYTAACFLPEVSHVTNTHRPYIC